MPQTVWPSEFDVDESLKIDAVGLSAADTIQAPTRVDWMSAAEGRTPVARPQLGDYRKTSQLLAPAEQGRASAGSYELFPAHPLPRDVIGVGFDGLAEQLAGQDRVRIDGYVGIFWEHFREGLQTALAGLGVDATWIDVSRGLKSRREVDKLVDPCLGGDDPVFGFRFQGRLADFFDSDRLAEFQADTSSGLTILYGCGAGLVDWQGALVYVDLPKNEVQYRSRAGKAQDLGGGEPTSAKSQYKRFYYVDWPALNRHKAEIVDRVDWFVDGQRPDALTFIAGAELRNALDRLSSSVFRVRPWFESGPWGGDWIKQHLSGLPQDVPNYAWSYELITPENGLLLGDGRHLVEISFDWLMYRNHRAVLGESADRFGFDFPIRFNFLDTFNGGNLSVQCHPRTEYIREQFGEPFTQDEAYYIVDCQPGAEVYLGFVADVDAETFRKALERSCRESTEVDVKRFVSTHPTRRHSFFLIPGGTVHCSGANNLVLEISATTYLYTFKMYDWLRMDLDGLPRPLHIERAFDNLCFDRQGDRVVAEHVSRPRVVASGEDWRLVHLPTHDEHFYDVHRYEFDTEVEGATDGSPHVMMLVEGACVTVETANGASQPFHFAETFVVPAAAGSYRLINRGQARAMVVKAFLKSQHRERR